MRVQGTKDHVLQTLKGSMQEPLCDTFLTSSPFP